MNLVVEHCPLCKNKRHRFFEAVQDNGHSLTYMICDTCGLVFQSPRMSDGELKDFYQAEYRRLVQDDVGPTEKDQRVQAGRARNLLKFLLKNLDLVRSHLDIGSSAGTLLEFIQKQYKCTSVGIEPGDAYRTFSQERGWEVVADLGDIDDKYSTSFDLVTMAHVLEHLPDPVGYLRNLREKWMTPGGHLLIEVPNLNGHTALELSHLTAYSSMTLQRLLDRAGYHMVALEAHGHPRSRLIPLYLTALAQESSQQRPNVSYWTNPSGILFRRKIGMLWARSVTRILPGLAWLPWPELDE
ncbi:MAG TPA: class I SAM-dependent methyltransferase [Anaerolineae bacterium]|nr:class I SAM-dependent methyltransferase [Anaerolineae bacterium]